MTPTKSGRAQFCNDVTMCSTVSARISTRHHKPVHAVGSPTSATAGMPARRSCGTADVDHAVLGHARRKNGAPSTILTTSYVSERESSRGVTSIRRRLQRTPATDPHLHQRVQQPESRAARRLQGFMHDRWPNGISAYPTRLVAFVNASGGSYNLGRVITGDRSAPRPRQAPTRHRWPFAATTSMPQQDAHSCRPPFGRSVSDNPLEPEILYVDHFDQQRFAVPLRTCFSRAR